MAKVPKHRRIKRATVLIKRTRCIKNPKSKPHTPLYQKLKVNNHSLAKALSQERQEYRMLFTRNNELLAEIQDLVHACNKRDLVITNILKNSKDMMQMLVTMSGFLSNTISSCQEFVSNQVTYHRTSTSSTGRRESTKRMSTKSPARGVVKPMVSGHTITKPTINLSRVNMQRPPNTNLSIIEEGSSSPERTSDRSVVENRRSRTLSERLPVAALRNEDDERVVINGRTSRYSGGRLSSGRYSKRNSGRLSGRLPKRSSESFEIIKSPRVTLHDVSRYLTNNQTINARLLSETSNGHNTSNTSTASNASNTSSPEGARTSDQSSSPDDGQANRAIVQPESQAESCETTSESDNESTGPRAKRPSTAKATAKRSVRFQSRSSAGRYELDDPLEGSSWMYTNASVHVDEAERAARRRSNLSPSAADRSTADMELEQQSSPVSSLPAEQRRSSGGYFRVPELPKRFAKQVASSRLNLNDEFDSPGSRTALANALETSSRYDDTTPNNAGLNLNHEEDDEDEGDRRVNLCFITQRRGPVHDDEDDDDDDDDETIMLNMRRQLSTHQPQQPHSPEQSERMQFDINELLQLTPLKPLLNISCAPNNGPAQPEPEPEPTVTVQLTQRCQPNETITMSRQSTIKLQQSTLRSQEAPVPEAHRMSDLVTQRLSSRIELPRLTELHAGPENGQYRHSQMLLSPELGSRQLEKRKRTAAARQSREEARHSASEDEGELTVAPRRKQKQSRQRKKKSDAKDPSSAKVVLQKLNESQRHSSRSEFGKSEHKNSDESMSSSARSSVLSRADPLSDSESSTASANSGQVAGRPRRQKAPRNLREPSLSKKLRRG